MHAGVDTLSPYTILVADDDLINFSLIESILNMSSTHYNIIYAENGYIALEILKSVKNISLILMDIQMPIMDGLTATKEIRKFNEHIPVIVQTSYSIHGVREKAMKSGCSDFITKPLNS